MESSWKSDGHLKRKKAVISGVVYNVGEFNAYLNLDVGLYGRGLVNITQLRTERIQAPLSDHIEIGERLSGLYLGIDRRTRYFEVSPRKLRLLHEQPARGVRSCEILAATEFGAEIESDGVAGFLASQEGTWSQYQILLRTGVLCAGAELSLYCLGKSDQSGRVVFRFPRWQLGHDSETVICGELIAWKINSVDTKEHELRNILFVHTGAGYLYRVEANDVLDAKERFQLGQDIQITQGDKVQSEMATAKLGGASRTPVGTLLVSECVSGKVIKLSDGSGGGGLAVIRDGVLGFLPTNTILPGSGRIDSVLKVGDWVEAEVVLVKEGERRAQLKFLRLIQESTESTRERNPLIDVRSARMEGKRGGFRRDAAFRQDVLEAYDHTCCICGSKFVVGAASCMEAAHVIPRSQRGADTLVNGICLCPIHHWAFDRGLLTINEHWLVRVSKAAGTDDAGHWLVPLEGKEVRFPHGVHVSEDAIEWHRRNIFLPEDDRDEDHRG